MEMVIYWAVFALVLGTVLSAMYFSKKRSRKHTEKTTAKVSRLLKQMAPLRSWKVLDDVTLRDGEEEATLSHVVIGPFGVVLVQDVYQDGSIYGDLDSEEWVVSDEDSEGNSNGKIRIPNPVLSCRKAEAMFRKKLSDAKIYKISVDSVVVKTLKQVSYITGGKGVVLSRKELKEMLSNSKYEKDAGVQIEAIAELLKA